MGSVGGSELRRRLRGALGQLTGSGQPVSAEAHDRLQRSVKKLQRTTVELSRQTTQLQEGLQRLNDADVRDLRAELTSLKSRVLELESDLAEQRGLGTRVAEVTDVVAYLLGAAAREDQAEFQRRLGEYADGL